jgi:hypothetical protein
MTTEASLCLEFMDSAFVCLIYGGTLTGVYLVLVLMGKGILFIVGWVRKRRVEK